MNAQKALSFFNSLSVEQQEFVKNKTISSTMSVRRWKGFMAKSAAYDTYADNAIKITILPIVLGIIFGIFFFVITFVLSFYAIILFIACLVLVVYQVIMRKKLKLLDLNNYLRLFFFPLLEVLTIRAGEEAKLSATLDFRDPRKALKPKEFKLGEKNVKHYQPLYIKANVNLLDKTEFECMVGEEIKDLRYWKRGSSGKMKLKTKTKLIYGYIIKLNVDKSFYKFKQIELPANVFMEDQEKTYSFKYKGKEHATDPKAVLTLKNFLDGIQTIYSMLEPLKEVKWNDQVQENLNIEETTDNQIVNNVNRDSGLPMMMWYSTQFDSYDYDSVEYSGGTVPGLSENEATVFDS